MANMIGYAKAAYDVYNLLMSSFPSNEAIGKFRAEQAHKAEVQSILTAINNVIDRVEEIERSKAVDLIKDAASFWYDTATRDIVESTFRPNTKKKTESILLTWDSSNSDGLSKASIENHLLDRVTSMLPTYMTSVSQAVHLLGGTLTAHAENYDTLLVGCNVNFYLHATNEMIYAVRTGKSPTRSEVKNAIETNLNALTQFGGHWITYRQGLIKTREVLQAAEHHHHGPPPPPIHTGVHTVYQDTGDAWLGSLMGKQSNDAAFHRDAFNSHEVLMNYWNIAPSARLFGETVGVWIELKNRSNS